MYKNLKILAVITTLSMVFVQIGGALVTKTGSADGCGQSWPLCHGRILPSEWPIETIIELAHRGVSGIAIILVGVLSFLALKLMSHKKETKFLVGLSIAFIIVQALLGAAAVMWGQNDFVLAAHFGISLISFAAVFLLTLLVFEVDQKFEAQTLVIGPYLRYHTIFLTIYIYLVVYSGALVRHTDSSLACLSWPHCSSDSLWANTFYEWVQMGHRVLAGIIIIWIFIIMLHVLKHYSGYRVLKYGWIIAFILVLLHALFITLLFGLLCYFILLLYRSK